MPSHNSQVDTNIVIQEVSSSEYARDVSPFQTATDEPFTLPTNNVVNWDTVSRPDLVRARIQASTLGKPVQYYLGPPDLCCYELSQGAADSDSSSWFSSWFTTGATNTSSPSAANPVIRFHWVLGIDCANPLALGNYIRQVHEYFAKNNASWFAQDSLALQNASILIWNPLRQMDLSVTVRLPGTLTVQCLKYESHQDDASPSDQSPQPPRINITRIPLKDTLTSEDLWNELYTCSVLRYFAYVSRVPIQSPATRVLDIRQHLNPESEQIILKCIEANIQNLYRSGTHYKYHPHEPNQFNNQLIYALRDYFSMQAKHRQGIEFFKSLATTFEEPAFLILAANLYLDIDADEQADKLISQAIQRCAPEQDTLEPPSDEFQQSTSSLNTSRSTTYSLSYIYLALQQCEIYCHKLKRHGSLSNFQVQYAIHLLNIILKDNADLRCAHLFFAQIVAASDPKAALKQLNLVKFIPAHVPHTTYLTPLSTVASLQDLPKWLRISKQNYAFPVALDTVVATPGLYAKVLPGLYLTQAEQELYDVLVLLLQQHGWKQLLEARSSVFLMQSDIEKAKQNKSDASSSSSTAAAPTSQSPSKSTTSTNSSSPAVTLHIHGLKPSAREQLENMISDLNFVTACNVDVDTKVALIALTEPRSEKIVTQLIEKIGELGFVATLDAPPEPDATTDEEPLSVSPQDPTTEEASLQEDNNSQAAAVAAVDTTTEPLQEQDKFDDVDIDEETSSAPAKVFCQKYFDALFGVLHQDLVAFSRYQKETRETLESYTSLDWAFIGSLLERIGYTEAALVAYKRSISLGVNTKALLRCLDHAIHKVPENGTAKRSRVDYLSILALLDQSIVAHESNLFEYNDPIQIVNQPPLVIQTLRRLVGEVGVTQIRDMCKELFGSRSQVSVFVFDEMLFDLIRDQCDGFNR